MHYSGIEPCDVLNGTGFRTVIWVSGCSIGCKGCFNPSTHNPNYGKEYTQETQKYLLKCLSKDYIDGITITGGNPLESYNLDTILSLIKEIRLSFPEKSIWLYTGYRVKLICRAHIDGSDNYKLKHEYVFCTETRDKNILNDLKRSSILNNADVIIDGEYIDEQRNLSKKWAGSDNQRVISVAESLAQNKIVLYCD